MANTTIKIPRAHLIMALCLPLAVMLGYFLAEPMESGSMAVIVMIMFVLAVPLMMKWHHPVLILSWNACVFPAFVPGQPQIWIPIAAASLLFAVLNRSVNPEAKFIYVPSIANSLLFLAAVILVTAFANGGIGIRSLGGANYGGKNYVYIFMAVAGFFAFSSLRIPPEKAALYVGMFFLSGLSGIMPNLIYKLGPAFYPLFYLFPASLAMDQARADYALSPGIFRINGLSPVGTSLYCYILARYGIRGTFDFSKPWRFLWLMLAVACCALCGYRSSLILLIITFGVLFYFEGLHKTRWLPTLLAVSLILGLIVLPQADKLPWVVQRSISFLPGKIDPIARENAEASTDWRLDIWKQALPHVPEHLLMGKGYSMDPNALSQTSTARNWSTQAYDWAYMTGDFHSGPLSVLIPTGIWGTGAFIWFLIAAGSYLLLNHRRSELKLQRFNTFILAFFIAKVIAFCFVFGSFQNDLAGFTGLVGLSLSLNGQAETVVESEAAEPEQSALEAFS